MTGQAFGGKRFEYHVTRTKVIYFEATEGVDKPLALKVKCRYIGDRLWQYFTIVLEGGQTYEDGEQAVPIAVEKYLGRKVLA